MRLRDDPAQADDAPSEPQKAGHAPNRDEAEDRPPGGREGSFGKPAAEQQKLLQRRGVHGEPALEVLRHDEVGQVHGLGRRCKAHLSGHDYEGREGRGHQDGDEDRPQHPQPRRHGVGKAEPVEHAGENEPKNADEQQKDVHIEIGVEKGASVYHP